MISCKHAQQLFDRYLDGELSPSLQQELHAHQIACSSCASELAVLEACGDVIRLDRREPVLRDSFTDIVLAALPKVTPLESRPWFHPVRLAGGGSWGRVALTVMSPLAAAASIALAVMVTLPSLEAPRKTAVLGGPDGSEAAPPQVRNQLTETHNTKLSPEQKQGLEEMPQMSTVNFFDALYLPFVEQAQAR